MRLREFRTQTQICITLHAMLKTLRNWESACASKERTGEMENCVEKCCLFFPSVNELIYLPHRQINAFPFRAPLTADAFTKLDNLPQIAGYSFLKSFFLGFYLESCDIFCDSLFVLLCQF